MQGSAEVTTDEKLSLIKKAYRALKAETERREADLAAERAGQQRERGLLVARVDELQRELHETKEAVRKAGADAAERLRLLAQEDGSDAMPPPATPPPASSGDDPMSASMASYNRGADWADRVLNARDVFKTALATSIESVSGLAVPQTAQLQLERQERVIEAQTQVRTAARNSAQFCAILSRSPLTLRRYTSRCGST